MKLVKNYFPFLIEYMHIHNWLVVSIPLKNMKVSWDDYSQYIEKNVPNHQSHNLVCILSVQHAKIPIAWLFWCCPPSRRRCPGLTLAPPA